MGDSLYSTMLSDVLGLGSKLGLRVPDPELRSRFAVYLFAGVVALVFFCLAFGVDRNVDVDEAGLLNPPYMYARYGHIAYPVYGYPDAMVVHPPLHAWLIGYLWKHGVTLYYAEAFVPALLVFLIFIAVLTAPFPSILKLALLFGIAVPFAQAFHIYFPTFGTRPETHVYAAWFLGLVLLEAGRLSGWETKRLFLGSFFVTYASGVHYYAVASSLAALIYMVWAVWNLGWHNARRPIRTLAAGGMLFGIPYLILFVIPHYREMFEFIRAAQGGGGIADAVQTHLQIYRNFAGAFSGMPWLSAPLSRAVPLLALTIVFCILFRPFAGMAIATVPLQLFILFFARHKLGVYCLHEVVVYCAALAGVALSLLYLLWRRIHLGSARALFLPSAAVILAVPLLSNDNALHYASFNLTPKVNESEIARSATLNILGPNARVAGLLDLWYASGAHDWFGLTHDLLGSPHISVNLTDYFHCFDAIVEGEPMSDRTGNDAHQTISTWYRDGLLKLRGFYFGESLEPRFLLLSPDASSRVMGYGFRQGSLYRFDEKPDGDFDLLSIACPQSDQLNGLLSSAPYNSVIHVPNPAWGEPSGSIATVLLPHVSKRTLPHPDCHLIYSGRATRTAADWRAMVQQLRAADLSIKFPQSFDELPGYKGIGATTADDPPMGAVTLGKLLDIRETHALYDKARVGWSNGVTVVTAPDLDTFSAAIPIHKADSIRGPCWVHIKAHVVSGRIGMGVLSGTGKGFLFQQPVVLKNPKAVDLYFPLATLRDAGEVVIFGGSARVQSTVEIEAADVAVDKQQWARDQPILTAYK